MFGGCSSIRIYTLTSICAEACKDVMGSHAFAVLTHLHHVSAHKLSHLMVLRFAMAMLCADAIILMPMTLLTLHAIEGEVKLGGIFSLRLSCVRKDPPCDF